MIQVPETIYSRMCDVISAAQEIANELKDHPLVEPLHVRLVALDEAIESDNKVNK